MSSHYFLDTKHGYMATRIKEVVQKYLAFLKRIATILERDFKDLFKESKSVPPDPKGIPYLALAKKINASIWSNDKKLKANQSLIEVLTTSGLISRFR